MNFFKKFNKLDLNNKDDKKKFISLCISLVGVFLLVAGTSYAYLTFRSVGEVNTITAGTLSMSIPKEDTTISIVNAMPMVDSVGLEQEKTYTFTIENNSSIKSYYEVRLDNICVVNKKVGTVTPQVCVPDEYIKVGIKKGNSEYEIVTLGEDGKITSGYMTSNNETISFELKIWLDETTPTDYSSKVGNVSRTVAYLGKLDLFSRQLVNEEKAYFDEGTYFDYTGSYETYTAYADGYYYVEAYGGASGDDLGKGGSTSGYIYLEKNEKLYIYVGGKGAERLGGYNGGGNGGTGGSVGAGAGGATDIRYFGSSTPSTANLVWNSSLGLNSRIMVAAGSASSYNYRTDSASIGTDGKALDGGGLVTRSARYAGEAFQTSGGIKNSNASTDTTSGSFGIGGNGGAGGSSYYGGGAGGGGYYGGAGGGGHYDGSAYWSSGTGGTSFISGYAGVNAISGNSTTITHSNNTAHYSGKYFIGGAMESGVNSGDGHAYIRYVGTELSRRTDILDNVRYIKDCQNGNTTNTINHWNEIQAIYNGQNVAYGRTVTGTSIENSSSSYKSIVDGKVDHTFGEANSTGLQCVTIDLGKEYDLDEIAVWHYFKDGRTYNSNVTYVSSDNETFKEVINNTEKETSMGKRVSAYGNVTTYAYTGSHQTFTAEYSGNYLIEAYGASGGYGVANGSYSYDGGNGGYTSGNIYLDKNDTLYIYVGGAGGNATDSGTGAAGGYNGGATGGGDLNVASSGNEPGGGGGGATDIRYFGNVVPSTENLVWNSSLGLNNRIMVAGGGGGGSYDEGGKAGGSLASQISGASFGAGAIGLTLNGGTGGGGGGYYGGLTSSDSGYPGYGGSSYISGYIGSIAIASSSLTNDPRTVRNDSTGVACTETTAASDITCSYHYSGKTFTSATMSAGVNSGNGLVIITYIGS